MKALMLSSGSSINTPAIFETHFDAKLRKMRVAYIKNATDTVPGGFDRNYISNTIERWVKFIDIIDLYESAKVDWDNYDVIWVGGGLMLPLHKAVFETGFNEQLPELLSEGMMYVGSSAGAMIASSTQKVCGWYPDEEELEIITRSGLGWLPFEIFPHYDESAHKDLIQKSSTDPIILLPDNSAIGIDRNELRFYNQARLLIQDSSPR